MHFTTLFSIPIYKRKPPCWILFQRQQPLLGDMSPDIKLVPKIQIYKLVQSDEILGHALALLNTLHLSYSKGPCRPKCEAVDRVLSTESSASDEKQIEVGWTHFQSSCGCNTKTIFIIKMTNRTNLRTTVLLSVLSFLEKCPPTCLLFQYFETNLLISVFKDARLNF
ncbi:hypothetical protein TNCV_4132641 [Trichonephila clavipes]|nr:hypothetical protein TNCV_4132641 [Trichonephila clavipes]